MAILDQYVTSGGPTPVYASLMVSTWFTISEAATVTDITIYAKRRSSSTDVGTLEIWTCDQETGEPDTMVVAIPYDGALWVDASQSVELPEPLDVTPQLYALVLKQSAALLGNCVDWLSESLGNHSFYSGDGGTSWTAGSEGPNFIIYGTTGLAKATNPSPSDSDSLGASFSWSLSWDNAAAERFDVYVGSSAESLTRVAEDIVTDSCSLPSAVRDGLLGGKIYWRVDSKDSDEMTIGDVWRFDPRPAKATNPTPADDAADQSLYAPLSWDAASAAATYTVHVEIPDVGSADLAGLTAAEVDTVYSIVHTVHGVVVSWRVDTVNAFGTTTGDTWRFGTLIEAPPLPSWSLLPGKTLGPVATWGEDLTLILPGTEGIDFVWNGLNNMRTTRRLVAAARDSIWYGG